MSLIIILADHSRALNYPAKKTLASYYNYVLYLTMNKQRDIKREKNTRESVSPRVSNLEIKYNEKK